MIDIKYIKLLEESNEYYFETKYGFYNSFFNVKSLPEIPTKFCIYVSGSTNMEFIQSNEVMGIHTLEYMQYHHPEILI